jgi:hypothetical protein
MTLNAFLKSLLLMPLFETPGDGGAGGGTGTGADAGGTGAAGTGTGTAAGTAATGTAAGTSTAQPGAASGFTYKEDRSDWVPKHRFNEVNGQAQRARQLETELEVEKRRVQALSGVIPADPGSEKQRAIDAAFRAQYPHLVPLLDLSKEQIEALTSVPDQISRVGDSEKREWARLGKSQMTSLYAQVAESIGADSLNSDQQQDLQAGFANWFRARCGAEIQASEDGISDTLQRYEDGDPELMKEFVKRYTANWVEPARRRVTQQTLTRTRPTPNSQGRTQVTSVKRPEKFKNLDERIEYAASLAKERGVSFADR